MLIIALGPLARPVGQSGSVPSGAAVFFGGPPVCAPGPPRLLPSRRPCARPPVPPPVIMCSLLWYCVVCLNVWCGGCQPVGRVSPVGRLLGSLRSLRFKCALVGVSLPLGFPLSCFRHVVGPVARLGGILGSRWSLRFKCPRVAPPFPPRSC